ncbi:MAG: GTPase [Phycisphaerae bacterium]
MHAVVDSGFALEAAPARLHAFVRRLLERARRLRSAVSGSRTELADTIESLQLGEALLRLSPLERPQHVVILGPTQAGKSTIVNLLLGETAAGVSPLAGFTVHAQAFTSTPPDENAMWQTVAFPGFGVVDSANLSRERLDSYAFEALHATARDSLAQRAVVWDTPDFDSLAAAEYRGAIFEAVGLADVLVVAMSKEKYSDLAVWRVLRMVEPLGRPVLLCVNKMSDDAREVIERSLRERLAEHAPRLADAAIEMIPYQPALAADEAEWNVSAAFSLRKRVHALLDRHDKHAAARGVVRYARGMWPVWLAPIEAELAAEQAWQQMVAASVEAALGDYRRDFLDHPTRYDSFRRATLRLLQLLEVPGLSAGASWVRDKLTFPLRWALSRGRELFTQSAQVPTPTTPNEELALREATERMLTTLERDARRRCDSSDPGYAIWQAAARGLEGGGEELRAGFAGEARDQRARFEPEIEAAANRLFEALQKNPAVLHSLRGARAVADLASVALAVKTGGMSAETLVFAPAMLAVTSFLTESALGGYMRTIEADLKKRQLEHVRREVFEGAFMSRLRGLPTKGDASNVGISRDEIEDAAAALDEWERSIR